MALLVNTVPSQRITLSREFGSSCQAHCVSLNKSSSRGLTSYLTEILPQLPHLPPHQLPGDHDQAAQQHSAKAVGQFGGLAEQFPLEIIDQIFLALKE